MIYHEFGRSFGPVLARTWPPFALVAGLLVIGRVAAEDGVFAAAGSRIARLRGGPDALLAAMLGLDAAVTAVLNLDTAVVLLTPVLLETARARGIDEQPLLYGGVLMANSASLLLPGSNLTNLLVTGGAHPSGWAFASRMALPWICAVVLTWLVVRVAYRHRLRATTTVAATRPRVHLRGAAGPLAIAAAAGLVVASPDPALPVFGVAAAAGGLRVLQRRASMRDLLAATGPPTLVRLLGIAVLLGTAARGWGALDVLSHASAWESAAAGAVAAVVLNNLPAAVLLSAHPPAHPLHLLLGLDLGPNLTVTGSLSALLWLRVARGHGAEVSAARYSRLGAVLVPLTLAATALALALP